MVKDHGRTASHHASSGLGACDESSECVDELRMRPPGSNPTRYAYNRAVLEARDLECERGGKKLFRPLSFALAPGETLRVAGANGSGKTSLLRMLCGLLTPSAGEVLWNATPIQSLREEYASRLVYLG